jgi:hypothetical protein
MTRVSNYGKMHPSVGCGRSSAIRSRHPSRPLMAAVSKRSRAHANGFVSASPLAWPTRQSAQWRA